MRKVMMQLADVWWMILLSVSSGVAGQTMIKLGVSHPGATDATSNLGSLLFLIVRSPYILLGLGLYGLGALAWIAVLARLDLSIAYPFLALNFVLVALVSYAALGESIPILRWMGILVICAGIFLVARSSSS
jgi:multidrug transporter EmrE-like cation transporter